MWNLLGSVPFVLALVIVVGAGLLAVARKRGKSAIAAAAVAFVVLTGALAWALSAPTMVDDGVQCDTTTLDAVKTEPLDLMTAEELAAAGMEPGVDECLDASRTRYGLAVGGYLVIAAGVGRAIVVRSRKQQPTREPSMQG